MSTARNKGRIKNTSQLNGGMSYVREQPGITLPSDFLSDDELKALSGPVVTVKMGRSDRDEV